MAFYPITPTPKPRMTQSDKWKKRPSVARYRAFCDEARLRMGALDLDGARIVFYIPMPYSWSKKKCEKMCGTPHRQVPDLSNILKALEDALYVGERDDCVIASYSGLYKVWSEKPGIQITEMPQ